MDYVVVISLNFNRFFITHATDKNFEYDLREVFLNREGLIFLKVYIPIRIVAVINSKSPMDIDVFVKLFMAKYGINSVRGGSYRHLKLSTQAIEFIEAEIDETDTYRCKLCGGLYHNIKECSRFPRLYGIDYTTENDNDAIDCISWKNIRNFIKNIIKS
jgi:hypothetical protein